MLQIKQKNAGSRAEWLVNQRYTFGTGPENNYKVSGDGVKSLQAALEVDGDHVVLFNLGGGDAIKHNGDTLESRSELTCGDEFQVGNAHFIVEDPKKIRAQKQQQSQAKPINKHWHLKALNTALANKSFDLDGEKVIGRANDCDICLSVVHLSRHHARISVNGNDVRVDDLNSSNGTYVNGNKIESAIVKAGDEVRFDTLKFTLLGPETNDDHTRVRPQADADATTVRPAIRPPVYNFKAQPEPQKLKSNRPLKAKQDIKVDNQIPETNSKYDDIERRGNMTMVFFGVIALLTIIASTYFLFLM